RESYVYPHSSSNPTDVVFTSCLCADTVILSGLLGNLWQLVNPWTAIYDAVARFGTVRPRLRLPAWLGVWPAALAYFAFACLELTSGISTRPPVVAGAAGAYTAITLAGMFVCGRDAWLERCEAFSVLFGIIARFGPVEVERDHAGRLTAIYLRPWGVGLLQPAPGGWDRVVFIIL